MVKGKIERKRKVSGIVEHGARGRERERENEREKEWGEIERGEGKKESMR